MSKIKNSHAGTKWQDLRKELFTPEDIAASDVRVAIAGELIKARKAMKLSQVSLGEQIGIKQPMIARIEKGTGNPKLETIIKILEPLGKTLAVVDKR